MLCASDPRVLQPPAHPIPPWQPAGYQDFALAKLDALGAVLSAPAFLNGAGSTRGMRGGGQSVHGPPPPHGFGRVGRGVAFLAGGPVTLLLRLSFSTVGPRRPEMSLINPTGNGKSLQCFVEQ